MDFKKLLLLCFYIAYVYSLSLKQLNYQMICMVNKERAKVNAPYLAYSRYVIFILKNIACLFIYIYEK